MSHRGWFAARRLAGLPGIPKSPSGAIRWLCVNKISSREAPGRGGPNGRRIEYLASDLPTDAQAALAARNAGAAEGAKIELRASLESRAAETARIESLKSSAALPDRAQRRIDAKLLLLHARESFAQSASLPVKSSEHHFAAEYNGGGVAVSDEVRALVPRLSAPTLARWRRELRDNGISALGGAYGNRRGDGKLDRHPTVSEFVIGMLVRTPHARTTQVMRAILAAFPDLPEMALPSKRSLARWLKAWRAENAETLTALANPDKWKSKYMVAFGSASEGIVRLNQRWELDATPGDVMLADGRHQVLGVIDIYSRRAKLLVSRTNKAEAVAQLVRGALLEFGVPEQAKTDNGSDYKSKHVLRVFASLDVEQIFCPPFQPWHKPHIERFFGTFTRDLVELLGNFIGHNVAERQAIRDRQSFADRLMKRGEVVEISMTAAEFQRFCDRWIEAVYMLNPHKGLDGRTPFEAVSAWHHPVRRIEDERALDILLAPAAGGDGWRIVQKKGLLIDNAWFIAPELEAFVGQRVMCLALPDLGRIVVQGGPDMRHVCIAECPERTGMDRAEVAAKGRSLQRERVQEDRRRLRAIQRATTTDDIVERMLVEREAARGKLVMLPAPQTAHTSAGLTAAADAAAALARPARSTAELMSDEDFRRARERIEAAEIPAGTPNELAARREAVQPIFENKYQRVMWLARQMKVRELSTEEREYLADYKREQPASYRSLMELVDEQMASANKSEPGATGSA